VLFLVEEEKAHAGGAVGLQEEEGKAEEGGAQGDADVSVCLARRVTLG
jgi:hypothetical protein